VVLWRPGSAHESTSFVQILGDGGLLSVSGPIDHRIAAIAQAQRGRGTRAQFLAAGVTSSAIHRRSAILEPRDACVHNGLPVTSPARTLLDIAATLPDRDTAQAVEQGLAKRLLTKADVDDILSRAAFERDRRRDAQLQAAGYTVIRIAARQIEDEPFAVIARLAQNILARAAAGGY
jgi:hypothetical protein